MICGGGLELELELRGKFLQELGDKKRSTVGDDGVREAVVS